jgi:hypothetical protein
MARDSKPSAALMPAKACDHEVIKSHVMQVRVVTYLNSCSVYGDSPRRILYLDYGINNDEITAPVVGERKCSCETSRPRADDKYGGALR